MAPLRALECLISHANVMIVEGSTGAKGHHRHRRTCSNMIPVHVARGS